ncbi:MAG: hypothetical protein HWN66_11335 [Candidatus Helarchaeota archaeon]|nr:hypothetical protein [Candidatus Helarchaeota archaeon]
MFEGLLLIVGFLVFSIIISQLMLKYVPSPFDKLITVFMVVGIIIYEFFHLVMCFIANTPVSSVKFLEKFKTEGPGYKKYEFNGSLTIKKEEEISFLQAILVGLAPLLLSFWLFFFLLEQLTHLPNPILFLIYLFIMFSIVFSAAPSSQDLKCIHLAFSANPEYSAYQIFLLILSIFLVWLIFPLLRLPNF